VGDVFRGGVSEKGIASAPSGVSKHSEDQETPMFHPVVSCSSGSAEAAQEAAAMRLADWGGVGPAEESI